jgi:hypothetical protein
MDRDGAENAKAKRPMKTLTLIITAAWLLAAPNPAAAQWTSDPYHGMANVCDAPGGQFYPQTHPLAGGRTLIIWKDDRRPPTGHYNIFYQVLDSCGNTLLQDNGAPIVEGNWATEWNNGETFRNLADDGSGGCIIVFDDRRDSTTDIYGQRVDSLGNRLWGPLGLHLVTWPGPSSTFVDVEDFASDSLGNYFLFFYKNDLYQQDFDIYAQKFTAEGELLWGPSGVPTCSGVLGDQYDQRGVPDQFGGVLVMFAREEVLPGAMYAYAQHLDAQGNLLFSPGGRKAHWPGGLGVGFGYGGYFHECVSDGQGGGVWSLNSGDKCGLICFNGNGAAVWSARNESMPFTNTVNLLRHPQDGSIWWLTSGHGYGAEPPYKYALQRYDLNGNQLFGPQGIHLRQGEQVVPTADGGVINVGYVGTPHKTRLFAQRIDTTGATVWETVVALGSSNFSGVTVFNAPSLCTDGENGTVITFVDLRHGVWPANESDISAQRVHNNGQLGCSPVGMKSNTASRRLITGLTDHHMDYTIPQASNIKIDLYDLLGRRVALIEEGYKEAGRYTAHLQTERLAAGVYFVRLEAAGMVDSGKIVVLK